MVSCCVKAAILSQWWNQEDFGFGDKESISEDRLPPGQDPAWGSRWSRRVQAEGQIWTWQRSTVLLAKWLFYESACTCRRKQEESRLFTLQFAFLSLLKNSNERGKTVASLPLLSFNSPKTPSESTSGRGEDFITFSSLEEHTHYDRLHSGPFESIKQSMHECRIVTQGSTNYNTRHTKTQLIEYRKVKHTIHLSLTPLQLIKTESGRQSTSPETLISLIEWVLWAALWQLGRKKIPYLQQDFSLLYIKHLHSFATSSSLWLH